MSKTILIVDDEEDIRMLIEGLLDDEGYDTLTASNSDQAYSLIEAEGPDLVIQDIWLQGSPHDGMAILQTVKNTNPSIPFIMISGHGTIETAVSSIKVGAYDFIEKPFKSDRLLLMIERALENADLKKQNAELKLRASESIEEEARQIPDTVLQVLNKVAPTNSRLLITGEAGSGKNIAAKYVHEHSARAHQPFMTLNCASMHPEKLEVELFGVTDGVAGIDSKVGLLELVNGGTLLLDEVMSLPVETQGKLLTLLQEGSYYKIGSKLHSPADIRVIATTSEDIEAKLKEGSFREDLYYRLNVVPVHIPPLRKRKQDILELIETFSPFTFSDDARKRLQSYAWPGNIKQLHNILEWLMIMHDPAQDTITAEMLPPEFGSRKALPQASNENSESLALPEHLMELGLREAREQFERRYLIEQIEKFDGNVSKTAEFIGMERSALHRKLKSLGVFSDEKQNVA